MYPYYGFYHHGFMGFWGLGWPIVAAIAIIPFWRICTRVGISPWLSLLLIVPVANLIFIYYLAFSDWPAVGGGAGRPGSVGTGPSGGTDSHPPSSGA